MTVTALTHDITSRTSAGLVLAVASATSFGLSGVLARGLLDTGWSAGATVALRIAIAAAVLVVPGALALRGRWHLVRDNASLIAVYGVAAVAGAQLCYFYAVTYMQVSVALLLEYTAPVAVVVWLWLRHGHRPSPLTLLGAGIAAAGLVLVLDVVSGAELSAVGVLWALGAMVGAATYFVISADEDNGLPGISLAAGGLLVGGLVLVVAGASGILPFEASTADAVYDGRTVAWWIPVVALGLVTAAFSYVTGIAAAVLVVPGALAVRGRWHLVRTNAGLVTVYGVAAVAGAQLCYFYAVTYMQVSVALLLEYTAPVAVVVWLWLRHGHRPSGLTLLGAAIAAGGLVLVLDVVSGAELSAVGVLWALGAMVGAATYFVISADEDNGLPGITLAAGGLLVGGVVLLVAGATGLLPFHASTADAVYDGRAVAWWIPVVALGLVTAAFSYVTGIAAGRRLGSRLASFVALGEVLAAVTWAWLLLGELPRPVQLAGGLLVLAGVVVVKLGESRAPLLVEPLPDSEHDPERDPELSGRPAA